MGVRPKSINVLARSLHIFDRKRSVIMIEKLTELQNLPLLVIYCCDITDSKYMATRQHGVSVNRPYVTVYRDSA